MNVHIAEIRNQILVLEREINEKIDQFKEETKIPVFITLAQEDKPPLGQIPKQKLMFKALI